MKTSRSASSSKHERKTLKIKKEEQKKQAAHGPINTLSDDRYNYNSPTPMSHPSHHGRNRNLNNDKVVVKTRKLIDKVQSHRRSSTGSSCIRRNITPRGLATPRPSQLLERRTSLDKHSNRKMRKSKLSINDTNSKEFSNNNNNKNHEEVISTSANDEHECSKISMISGLSTEGHEVQSQCRRRSCPFTLTITILCSVLLFTFVTYMVYTKTNVSGIYLTRFALENTKFVHRTGTRGLSKALSTMVHRSIAVSNRVKSVLIENNVIAKLNETKFAGSSFYGSSEDDIYAFSRTLGLQKSPLVLSGLDFHTITNIRRGILVTLSNSLWEAGPCMEIAVNFPDRLRASAAIYNIEEKIKCGSSNTYSPSASFDMLHQGTPNCLSGDLVNTHTDETVFDKPCRERRRAQPVNNTGTAVSDIPDYGFVTNWMPILQPVNFEAITGLLDTIQAGPWADLLLIEKCAKESKKILKTVQEFATLNGCNSINPLPQCAFISLLYPISFPDAYEEMYKHERMKWANAKGIIYYHKEFKKFPFLPRSQPSHWPVGLDSFMAYCNAFEPMSIALTKNLRPLELPEKIGFRTADGKVSLCRTFRQLTSPFDKRTRAFIFSHFNRVGSRPFPISCYDNEYTVDSTMEIKNLSDNEENTNVDQKNTDTAKDLKAKKMLNSRNIRMMRELLSSVQEQWSPLYMTPNGDVYFGYSVSATVDDSDSIERPKPFFWTSSAISLNKFRELLNPRTPGTEVYVVTLNGGIVVSTKREISLVRKVLPYGDVSAAMQSDCIPYTADDRKGDLNDMEEWLCLPRLSSTVSPYAYAMYEDIISNVVNLSLLNPLAKFAPISQIITIYPDSIRRIFNFFLYRPVVSVDVLRTVSSRQKHASWCENSTQIQLIQSAAPSFNMKLINEICAFHNVSRTLPWLVYTVLPGNDIFEGVFSGFIMVTIIEVVASVALAFTLVLIMRCISKRLMKELDRVAEMAIDKDLTFIEVPTSICEIRNVQMAFLALCDRLRETNVDEGVMMKARWMLRRKKELEAIHQEMKDQETKSEEISELKNDNSTGNGAESGLIVQSSVKGKSDNPRYNQFDLTANSLDKFIVSDNQADGQQKSDTQCIALKELAKYKNKHDIALLGIGSPSSSFIHTHVTVLLITIEYITVDASAFLLQEMITLVMRTCEQFTETSNNTSGSTRDEEYIADRHVTKAYGDADYIEGIIHHVTHDTISVVFLGLPVLRELFPGRFPKSTSESKDSDQPDHERQKKTKISIRDTVVRAVKVASTLAGYTNEKSHFGYFGNVYYTIDTEIDSLIDNQSPALSGCLGTRAYNRRPYTPPIPVESKPPSDSSAADEMKEHSDNFCLRAGDASKLFIRNNLETSATLAVDNSNTCVAACSKSELPHESKIPLHSTEPQMSSNDNNTLRNYSDINTTVMIDPLIILSSAFTVTEKIGQLQAKRLKSIITLTDRVMVHLPKVLLGHAAPVDCVEAYSSYIGPETALKLNALAGGHVLRYSPNGTVSYAPSELERLKLEYGSDWESKRIKISRSKVLQKGITASWMESSSDDDERKALEGMPYERRVLRFKPTPSCWSAIGEEYNADLSLFRRGVFGESTGFSKKDSDINTLVPQYALSTYVGAAAKTYHCNSQYAEVGGADVAGEECLHEEFLNVPFCGGFSTIRTLVYDFTVFYVQSGRTSNRNNSNIASNQVDKRPLLQISPGRLQQFQQAFRMLLAGNYGAAVGFLEDLSEALQATLLTYQKLMMKYAMKNQEEANAAAERISNQSVSSDNSLMSPAIGARYVSGPNGSFMLSDEGVANEARYHSIVARIKGHPQANISLANLPRDDPCGISLIERDPVLTAIRLINHVNRWKRIASLRIYSSAPYVRKESARHETSKQMAEAAKHAQ